MCFLLCHVARLGPRPLTDRRFQGVNQPEGDRLSFRPRCFSRWRTVLAGTARSNTHADLSSDCTALRALFWPWLIHPAAMFTASPRSPVPCCNASRYHVFAKCSLGMSRRNTASRREINRSPLAKNMACSRVVHNIPPPPSPPRAAPLIYPEQLLSSHCVSGGPSITPGALTLPRATLIVDNEACFAGKAYINDPDSWAGGGVGAHVFWPVPCASSGGVMDVAVRVSSMAVMTMVGEAVEWEERGTVEISSGYVSCGRHFFVGCSYGGSGGGGRG